MVNACLFEMIVSTSFVHHDVIFVIATTLCATNMTHSESKDVTKVDSICDKVVAGKFVTEIR